MKKNISIVLISFVLGMFLFNSCDKIDPVDGSYAKPVYTEKMNFVEFYNDAAKSFSSEYAEFNNQTEAKDNLVTMVVLSGDATVVGNTSASAKLSQQLDLNNDEALMVFNRKKQDGKWGIPQDKWSATLDNASDKGKVALQIEGDYADKTFKGKLKVKSTAHISQSVQLSAYIVVNKMNIGNVDLQNVLWEDTLNMPLANALVEDEEVEVDFDYTIKNYDLSYEYSLIVCVEDANTGLVLQAGISELKEQGDTGELSFYDKQKVLIEDFTGHKCGNCPKGHRALKSIIASNGEQVIGMAIHAGFFANPYPGTPFSADFRTRVGTLIADYYGLVSPPKGLINRTGEDNKKLKPVAEWETVVADLLQQSPKVGIALKANVSGNTISAKVSVKAFETVAEKCNVQLFVIENHIEAPQTDYSQNPSEVEEYDHEHMLRASMNGDWGELLNEGSFEQDQIISKAYSLHKKADWNAENLAVIAIVFDENTKEILQVEEAKL